MKTSKHARILQDEKAQSIAKIKNPVTPNIEHYLDGFFSELQHTPGPWKFEDEFIRATVLENDRKIVDTHARMQSRLHGWKTMVI